MELGIRGRRALVTGASRGIGLAVAEGLAAEGVDVALVARSRDLLERAAGAIEDGQGVRAVAVVADLSGLDGVRAAAREAAAALGGVDILINNAGAIPVGSLSALEDSEVLAAWDLKLHGYVRMARELLPAMQEQGWGRIVNIIGLAGKQPSAGYIYGGTANAALMNFTKGLALAVAKDGVLVNAINPGPIATDRHTEMNQARAREAGLALEEIEARQSRAVPMGRVGRPQEVADLAVYLSSERCGFVHAAVVPVGGGLGASL